MKMEIIFTPSKKKQNYFLKEIKRKPNYLLQMSFQFLLNTGRGTVGNGILKQEQE